VIEDWCVSAGRRIWCARKDIGASGWVAATRQLQNARQRQRWRRRPGHRRRSASPGRWWRHAGRVSGSCGCEEFGGSSVPVLPRAPPALALSIEAVVPALQREQRRRQLASGQLYLITVQRMRRCGARSHGAAKPGGGGSVWCRYRAKQARTTAPDRGRALRQLRRPPWGPCSRQRRIDWPGRGAMGSTRPGGPARAIRPAACSAAGR